MTTTRSGTLSRIRSGFAGSLPPKGGDHIVGLSSDDNISGMNFSRRGLSRLTAAVEAGGLDGVVVKDLSRLGRHRTQTDLFID